MINAAITVICAFGAGLSLARGDTFNMTFDLVMMVLNGIIVYRSIREK